MLPDDELRDLRQRFERFAQEAAGRSTLYAHLASTIAGHPAVTAILREAPPPQRRANLLFAAVHDRLLAGEPHDIARFYPSVGGIELGPERRDRDAAVAGFLDVLAAEHEHLMATMRTRSTQTNEVGRCAALWPALARMVGPAEDRPLALVELGASAGLLLHLDRYRYTIDGARSGDPSSPVHITTERLGARPWGPPRDRPRIAYRIGIDLAPLDVDDVDDARWLEACVWPEDVRRLQRLRAALTVARRHDDVSFVTGDLLEQLPDVLRQLPADVLPCVLHSAALAYLPPEARSHLAELLDRFGRDQDLAVLSLEGPFLAPFVDHHLAAEPPVRNEELFLVGATTWSAGRRADTLLARSHPHGAWVEALADR